MKIDSNKLDSKINLVCVKCGKKALTLLENKGKRAFKVSTYHKGRCDVCKEDRDVTETRDFGFPVFEMEEGEEEGKGGVLKITLKEWLVFVLVILCMMGMAIPLVYCLLGYSFSPENLYRLHHPHHSGMIIYF